MAELKPHIIDDGFGEPEQVRKIFVGNLPYEADEGKGVIFAVDFFLAFAS